MTAPVDEFIRTGSIVAVETMNESEYYGYTIRENPATGRWEIFWRERKQEVDFARKFEAEEWIDQKIPLNR